MRRPTLALACLALGVVLLIPFENWFTLAAGVFFLLAFVVIGTYTLTGPHSPLHAGDDEDAPG